MQLVFATNNKHKLEEIKAIVPKGIKILSLAEIGCSEELPETGTTLHQNSLQKARYVFDKYGEDCFADDTGLEIEALDGRPGVYSARYAGPQCNFRDNMNLVLTEMRNEINRRAQFRTVISLVRKEKMFEPKVDYFEGAVKGEITTTPMGSHGFGYDPIFKPEGYSITYAEMDASQKNAISHRAEAVKKLIEFLGKQI
jgi:XTP/dITP diphosphohydrolase